MEGEPQLERVWIRVCARACGGETPDTALIGITMSCRGEMRLTKPKATASHLTRSGSAAVIAASRPSMPVAGLGPEHQLTRPSNNELHGPEPSRNKPQDARRKTTRPCSIAQTNGIRSPFMPLLTRPGTPGQLGETGRKNASGSIKFLGELECISPQSHLGITRWFHV
jgi:hypothetical protein